MGIPRIQYHKVLVAKKGKITVIYGPRRVGKTTLLERFLAEQENYLFVTGEDVFVGEHLSSQSLEKLKLFIGNKELLVIDEAQYIPNIGRSLKLIIDHIKPIRVIVTGSSTFDLVKQIGEPLTGRQNIIKLFPVAQMELRQIETLPETNARLEERLIYGSYPETILLKSELAKQEYLQELVASYLIKDILIFEGVHKSKKLVDLLILLAYQIGKEVSITELGRQLSLSKNTVERYLDLLEKAFVVLNIRGFSRNLRKEVTKSSRYYFYDNGIRNALINNFNLLSRRDDLGELWENYIILERIKKQSYQSIWSNNYFWRTYDQSEIDWIEEREGNIHAFEIKWKKNNVKPPKLWAKTYPKASFECISRENYLAFIT